MRKDQTPVPTESELGHAFRYMVTEGKTFVMLSGVRNSQNRLLTVKVVCTLPTADRLRYRWASPDESFIQASEAFEPDGGYLVPLNKPMLTPHNS